MYSMDSKIHLHGIGSRWQQSELLECQLAYQVIPEASHVKAYYPFRIFSRYFLQQEAHPARSGLVRLIARAQMRALAVMIEFISGGILPPGIDLVGDRVLIAFKPSV